MAHPRRRDRGSPTRALARLEALKAEFGPVPAAQKCELLDEFADARLPTRQAVERLHEVLCFLRAHPDDGELLQRVVRLLEAFADRKDLRRWRKELADTGIAGTATSYAFYANTARWLCERFPGALRIDWNAVDDDNLLWNRLDVLATWSESPGLDEVDMSLRDWVQRLAGPNATDAEFVVRRAAQKGRDDFERDLFQDELDLPFVLAPTPDTPSRTRAYLPGRPVHHQTGPLNRQRPDLAAALRQRAIEKPCSEALGERIVALAREAMVVRHRDLDVFVHGDPRDVRLFDCGSGLEFAAIGFKPERRLLLEAVYGYLTLKNGVPIGYVLTSALFGSSEIAYNVFDTWRGGEAAQVYGHVLAVTKQLYGSDTFTVFPYQLGGGGNSEGLKSGAWWFYQKLGFRARDPEVLRTMDQELAKMAKDRSYRTPIKTLARIAEHNVYWSAGRQRDDVIGLFPLGDIGLAITDLLATRFGADRETAMATCADEAARLCSVRGWQKWSEGERTAWQRWAPLMLVLPGVATWTAAERTALADVARKKGGRRESDYVHALDAHKKLRAALRRLAKA
ncbi:MAG: hypothetical protein U1E73_03480 [Planctomycetota bacterium]